jgi:hypothetical protein
MTRFQAAFGALILAQAAHSAEECAGRLWESFPPARLVSGLISSDLERGFIVANVFLVGFGLWCWAWVALELVNGLCHSLRTLSRAAYTPGVATAPVLLVLAVYLASRPAAGVVNLMVRAGS